MKIINYAERYISILFIRNCINQLPLEYRKLDATIILFSNQGQLRKHLRSRSSSYKGNSKEYYDAYNSGMLGVFIPNINTVYILVHKINKLDIDSNLSAACVLIHELRHWWQINTIPSKTKKEYGQYSNYWREIDANEFTNIFIQGKEFDRIADSVHRRR